MYLLFRHWYEPNMSSGFNKKEPPRIRTTSFADPAGRDTRPPQIGGGVRISRKDQSIHFLCVCVCV